ncbi:aspartate aminotransferase family protein [Verrucosispora sioxanthis]|uniref:Aspartate aminotransferase family protein n=1 Tax=Verrucosispora sioxanthis TaxID=2499994 RepID=A0A6M1KZ57_9ACTN|nr:aspartate aminotransferase family protein [Verrucosispora sioxanthis]NEE63842.1 aspartate aminotransferase family protein [Verrucosispora sioxanthis]NGM12952.1 aspartate aminotransferase family protein [Verrucosispora sioxanthis]
MSAHDHHSDPLPDTAQGILAEDRAHLFYSWSAQRQLSPMPVARALGSYFWDYDGNRYLDFASQFVHVNIGHQHPKVVAAIQRQAERLCTVSPAFGNDQRARAARLIAERAPGDLDRVLFTNGGTDAVEHAVRMARLVTGRPKVLAAYRSYHGGSHLTLHMTGDPRRWPIDTGAAGVVHFFGPYLYRSAFHARTEPEEAQRALAHLEQVIALEGPGTVAAVILEPVVGTNGVLVPPEGYLAGVRELCDRHGILLIADEVMAGFGRTGRWFAVQNWDVVPDLITFAKGVNSGYVPLGGVLMGPRVFDAFADRPYPGGLTYSGHPLACAAAVAAITAMSEEGIVENAAHLGAEVLGPGLRELSERHPVIGEVRGLGVFWALELVRDRDTREMLPPLGAPGGPPGPMDELAAACRKRGLWPFVHTNRIHVVPPCTVTEREIREGLDILDEALSVIGSHYR